MHTNNYSIILLIITVLAVNNFICHACDTPVFRYAMQHWTPDNYNLVVITTDTPSENERKCIEFLNSEISKKYLNTSLYITNVNQINKSLLSSNISWLHPPCMVLWFPQQLFKDQPVWYSQLDSTSLKQLFDSPIRRQIARHLMDGDLATWILLESGIREIDEDAFTKLVNSLKAIQKDITQLYKKKKIPFISGEGSVAFSVIRLPRNTTEETVLATCLLATAGEIAKNNVPLAFAIFGRGRALPPVPHNQISPQYVKNICEFLVGDCSCEVKARNPGHDLLISADWTKARLPPEPELPTPLITEVMPDVPSQQRANSINSQSNTELESTLLNTNQPLSTSSTTQKPKQIIIVASLNIAGIMLLILAVIIWLIIHKKHKIGLL